MAYPSENEHKEYTDYVISMQEEGKKAMSKDEWRKRKKDMQETKATILSDG